MNISELLSKTTRSIERKDIEEILEDVLTSKDLSMSKLGSIITKGKTKVTKVNNLDVKRLLYVIVPYSIIKYDIKHAMELAGIDNEEMFMIKVVREATSDPEAIKKFKTNIYEGLDGKHGVYYKGKGDKEYAILSSRELYPNVDKFKDEGKYNHEFIINASGADYMQVMIQLVESFLADGNPFNMVVRLPHDMKDGYPDPIRLYCTDKNLQATIDEIERMTYVLKDRLQSPDWRICASVDGLYGYTQVDVDNHNITPMDSIFDVMTKTIDQFLTDYDMNHGNTQITEYNWKIRVTRLLKMKAMDSDAYEALLDNMMKYIEELNLDLNDVFKVANTSELDKNIKELDAMINSIDNMAANLTQEAEMPQYVEEMPEHEVELEEDLPPVGPIDEFTSSEEMPNVNVAPTEEPTASEGMPNTNVAPEEETKTEEMPNINVGIVGPGRLHYSELAKVLENVRIQGTAREEVNTENGVIENPELVSKALDVLEQAREIAQKEKQEGKGFVEVWEETQQERNRLEETQAYVPITEEQINEAESKTGSVPVLPDVEPVSSDLLKQIEDEANDEDEVSLNTGSYAAIPVEVTGFDNDEVKSIVDAPQAGETNSMAETAVALDEYKDILTAREALTDVINTKGETVSLIDYLKNEAVSTKIPLDSTVVLNDGNEISGQEFIKTYVIPVVLSSSTEQIFTVDQVINNYSTEIRKPEAKKKGFLARLFGGKKNK